MTKEKDLRFFQILAEHKEIKIPGFDITRTIVFFIFSVLLLLLLTNGIILKNEIKELSIYHSISTIVILIMIILSFFSGNAAIFTMNYPVKKIKKAYSIFYSKILINLAIMLFFLTICFWVILLGGVFYSPFATFLSISPLLLLIQIFRDYEFDEDVILTVLKEHRPDITSEEELKKWNLWKNISKVLNFIAAGFVLITLIIGWRKFNIFGERFIDICQSDWYINLYYSIYYLSVLLAILGLFPKGITQRFTEKLF